jgi:glycosyltransferase involved in cell wall biosynthesis
LILYMDADLPFDVKLIPQLLAKATAENIVVGCRSNRGEGGRRWLFSKVYNLLCNFVFGLHLTDINFACKIIPRSALSRMQLTSEGSFIDAELLLESRRIGLRTTEVPLVYYPRTRGQSTLSRPSVIVGILLAMMGYLARPYRLTYQRVKLNARPDEHGYRAGTIVFLIAVLLNAVLHPLYATSGSAIFLPTVLWIAWYCGARIGLVFTGLAALFITFTQSGRVSFLDLFNVDSEQLVLFVSIPLTFTAITAVHKWRHARRRKY